MTRRSAVLTRAAFVPAVVALCLAWSSAVSAEDAPLIENGGTFVVDRTPDDGASAQRSASEANGTTDAAAAERKSESETAAAKTAGNESDTAAATDAASPEAKPETSPAVAQPTGVEADKTTATDAAASEPKPAADTAAAKPTPEKTDTTTASETAAPESKSESDPAVAQPAGNEADKAAAPEPKPEANTAAAKPTSDETDKTAGTDTAALESKPAADATAAQPGSNEADKAAAKEPKSEADTAAAKPTPDEAAKTAGTETAAPQSKPDTAAAKPASEEPGKTTASDAAAPESKPKEDTANAQPAADDADKSATDAAAAPESKPEPDTAAAKPGTEEPGNATESKPEADAANAKPATEEPGTTTGSETAAPESKSETDSAAAKPQAEDKSAPNDAAASESKPAEDVAAKPATEEPHKTAATALEASTPAQPGTATEQDVAHIAPSPEENAAKPALAEEKPAQPKDEDAASGAPRPNTTTAALPEAAPAAAAPAGGVADQVLPPADAVVAGVRQKLAEAPGGSNEDEASALISFYDELHGPALWVSTSGLTAKGKAVVEEIGKADDWGLNASDFDVPHLAAGELSPDAAADAEIKLAQNILRYARYARGGRINPASISQLMDQSPTLRAPRSVLNEIAAADAPDKYLRSLHPQHEQFERLRQELLRLRGSGGKEDEEPVEDPALSVKLPPGGVIRAGDEDPQVALLRQRLKVPAEDGATENVYDENLQEAVRQFQRANNLRPDAILGNNTRAVLNGAPRPASPSADSKIERILINMERWRWVPADMGAFYVWDNVPEALTRIVKDGKIIHTDKIIVGQPSWPTPVFSADMKFVVFHPSWGVPEGIKRKELAPLLRKSSGAGLFGIFGGGYSAQAVLDAYELKAYYNGRLIDPNQVDWSSANIAAYSFQQPPSPKNVLGDVKFMFPNKHDVYMHDTPERHLFSRALRNLSHGCMRIADPRRFAEIILGQDKGWSAQKVRSMFNGYSNQVTLDTRIPVHVTYFTARVDDDGRLLTFGDFYGLDGRTAAALGSPVRFETPVYPDEEVAESAPESPYGYSRRQPPQKQYKGAQTLSDAISDIFGP